MLSACWIVSSPQEQNVIGNEIRILCGGGIDITRSYAG